MQQYGRPGGLFTHTPAGVNHKAGIRFYPWRNYSQFDNLKSPPSLEGFNELLYTRYMNCFFQHLIRIRTIYP